MWTACAPGLDMLPGDLGQAIDALKEDEVIQDALGQHVYPSPPQRGASPPFR